MALVKLDGYRCERCGHPWVPRDREPAKDRVLPTVCPKCKSPYWNKPRQAESNHGPRSRGRKK
ncbi:MAG: hypothetical protein ACRELB_14855 [Polyangiaceae bacterium]